MKIHSLRIGNVALAVGGSIVLACVGCRKDAPTVERSSTKAEPVFQEIARVHWLGTRQIASDTNAVYLTGLWALPESADLLAQTLDRLSQAPYRDLGTNGPAPENSSVLLRPLLEDLVREESFLRIRRASNSPAEAALAIRLAPERQALWSTNLAGVLQSLTSNGALTRQTNLAWDIPWGASNRIHFNAAKDWAVISFGNATGTPASNLLAEVRSGADSEEASSNYWVSVDADLRLLLALFKGEFGAGLLVPRVSARVHGDGEYVRTHAEFKFPLPLPFKLEPWQIPTNFIREPLISFTAVQGFQPWLRRLPWVREHGITNVPNQLFLWALNLTEIHSFAAAPMTNSAAEIDRLGEQLEGEWNAWITNQALGFAEYSAPNHGIAWTALPMVTPAFQALPSSIGDVVFGKLAPALPPPGEHAPADLMSLVSSRTNTLYYDWEITEMRVRHWVFLGQSARMAFHRAQLPPDAKSVALLRAVAPKLGNSVTELSALDSTTLRVTRKSHLGMTGMELHLLADWLESPRFPLGTHTTLAAPAPLLRWRAKTRSFETITNMSPMQREP